MKLKPVMILVSFPERPRRKGKIVYAWVLADEILHDGPWACETYYQFPYHGEMVRV